jgi:hypothetical protein
VVGRSVRPHQFSENRHRHQHCVLLLEQSNSLRSIWKFLLNRYMAPFPFPNQRLPLFPDLLNHFKSLLCAGITSPIPSSHPDIITTLQFEMSQSVAAFVASLGVPSTTATQLITQIQATPTISNLTSFAIAPVPALLPLACWVLNIILASGEVTFPPADQALVEVNW